jgi:hypothetical protein
LAQLQPKAEKSRTPTFEPKKCCAMHEWRLRRGRNAALGRHSHCRQWPKRSLRPPESKPPQTDQHQHPPHPSASVILAQFAHTQPKPPHLRPNSPRTPRDRHQDQRSTGNPSAPASRLSVIVVRAEGLREGSNRPSRRPTCGCVGCLPSGVLCWLTHGAAKRGPLRKPLVRNHPTYSTCAPRA